MNEKHKNLPKKIDIIRKQGLDALYDAHWRLRDEIIFREKEYKTGGFYDDDDLISKLPDEILKNLANYITEIRQIFFHNSDT